MTAAPGRSSKPITAHASICGCTVWTRQNRMVVDIRLPDGRDVAELLVAAGAAWVEPRYSINPRAPVLQAAAQRQHFGLWADPAAIPPWEWRHGHSVP